MSAIQQEQFQNPAPKYRVNPMMHDWPKDHRTDLMDAVKAFGFGGVVTNPSHKNGFTQNPENIREFGVAMREMEERGIAYWIYDENGYPSGYAGGLVLEGHPELEAKGFYMRRRIAYQPRHTTFTLDEESDKIVWVAKCPIETPGMHESFVQFEKMEPVPFTDTFCECDLAEKETLFIFCVKPAYEGSHCTHNVCSYARYINVMDERAVRRFIDLVFEPIIAQIPDAFARATAVFTDEPSLQVGYARDYEVWPYALVPWVDGLFEKFEAEYGVSILPYLPLLFEGQANAYPIRIKFYRLVGKIIAHAYSGQLAAWCEAHGGKFSGHYLGEESMVSHVKDYGSNLDVIKAASYPGIDVLCCYPEIYNYNTAKHAQMVVRKKGTNGMMAEICPFVDVTNFAKDPIENMTGVLGLLYLSGVRVTHSYFSSNFESYDPEKFVGHKGYMTQRDAIDFNAYVGRMGYMLDGIQNDCNTFVYYGVEDVQAKMRPAHSVSFGPETAADRSTIAITKKIYEAGHDFYYADRDDIVDASASLADGAPVISGCAVKTVIVPALDVVYDETMGALQKLRQAGVMVLFFDKVPRYGTDGGDLTGGGGMACEAGRFTPVTAEDILWHLDNRGDVFTATADGVMLIKGRFARDGKELYFVDNNTRQAADVRFAHTEKTNATVYNPVDGSIAPIEMGKSWTIPSFRGVFVLFD